LSPKVGSDQDQPDLEDLARLADPAVIADPYPLLARFREASPFAELDGALVVSGDMRSARGSCATHGRAASANDPC
jgi:hypothetical protein